MRHLLLLHGAIGAADQLEPLGVELGRDYLVHPLNFYGHGGEPMPNEPFSIQLFTDQVHSWLKEKGIDKIDIFGYSMGGYVALHLARQQPDRVGRIMTLGTKFNWTPEIAARELKMLNPDKIQEKIPAFALALSHRHAPNQWQQVLTQTANMMLAMGTHPPLVQTDFESIQNKVLICRGDEDEMVTAVETEQVHNWLPCASLTTFPGTRHPIEKVNVQLLATTLRYFFS